VLTFIDGVYQPFGASSDLVNLPRTYGVSFGCNF